MLYKEKFMLMKIKNFDFIAELKNAILSIYNEIFEN